MVADPDEVIRDLDDLVAQARQRFERFSAAQRRIENMTVTEHSASGLVRVTVRHTGAVVEVALADGTRSMAPDRVAGEVLRTVQGAQARIAERVRDVLRDTVPEGDPLAAELADEIVAGLSGRFPGPRSARPAGAPQIEEMSIGQLEEGDG